MSPLLALCLAIENLDCFYSYKSVTFSLQSLITKLLSFKNLDKNLSYFLLIFILIPDKPTFFVGEPKKQSQSAKVYD